MKTIGVRALRDNPGVLSQSAAAGEFVLLTNHNTPVSLAIPFDDDLLKAGIHVNLALKLYEDSVLTLTKSAKLARMSVEAFMELIANLDIVVVDQSGEELASDLNALD